MKIEKGCQFKKNGNFESIFVVEKLLDFGIPHARLVEQGGNNRIITISIPVLMDEKYWIMVNNDYAS